MADQHSPAPVGERVLWGTRLLLLVGVCGCAILATAVLWLATVDLIGFVADTIRYTPGDAEGVRADLVGDAVKIVDAYLLAAILFMVTFGLYELFIGRIDARRSGDGAPRVLVSANLDDLKDRIAKLVILILVIEFFQRAIKTRIEQPEDLLLLAGGVALISLAAVLPNAVDAMKRKPKPESNDVPETRGR